MTEKKRRPARKRTGPAHKSPYFLQPAKQGMVTVFRRPAGNRIDPKLCGTMASRAMALALVKQLEKAETVVRDLFLEATDDGIEALEAVLAACRRSVEERRGGSVGAHASMPGPGSGPAAGRSRRGRGRRRGAPPSPRADGEPPQDGPVAGAQDTSAA